MKKILLSLFAAIGSLTLFAQAPEAFIYHATVRNDTGAVMANQPVSFRFRILKGCPACDTVYEETHNDTANYDGSIVLIIGKGTDTIGNFTTINWGAGSYFLNVGLDTSGGTSYKDMGTSQFLSVPYALYAKKVANGFSGNYNDLTHKPITDGSETKLSAENNLKVTGSGTIDDPYIVKDRIHYVGESYGGGIVFYVYDNGQHGLIAATSDQDPGIAWYNGTKRYTNTTGDGLGAGEMNTTLIIALQTNDNPMGTFAAKVCADYAVTVNDVSYGDWYLPSKYELGILFAQKDLVGDFATDYYWSSTEFSSVSAWCQNFTTGMQFNLNKSFPYGVRAIRAF